MKKIIIASIVALGFAAPAYACPGHDEGAKKPQTAEKDKAKAPTPAPTGAPTGKDAKPADDTAKKEAPKTDKKTS